MTIAEQRHMAVVEAQLRRIADALERLNKTFNGRDIAIYENTKEKEVEE